MQPSKNLTEIELECVNEKIEGSSNALLKLKSYQSLQKKYPTKVTIKPPADFNVDYLYREASIHVRKEAVSSWLQSLSSKGIKVDVIHDEGAEWTPKQWEARRAEEKRDLV
jgi:hypothetical protein